MLRCCASLLRPAVQASLLRPAVQASLLRPAVEAKPLVPIRRWNQCTSYISLPPRNPMSLGESVVHCAFMFVVWLVPTFIGLSQVKVWKRQYLQAA